MANYYPSPDFTGQDGSFTGNLDVDGNVTVGGTEDVAGDFSVATNKMTVAASTGNTSVAGTLGVTGDVAVNTNKATIAAATGNTSIAGTAHVAGDFDVATSKFTVAAATGNTVIAGTLDVTGAVTGASFAGMTFRKIASGSATTIANNSTTTLGTFTRQAGEVVQILAFGVADSASVIWTMDKSANASLAIYYTRTTNPNEFQVKVASTGTGGDQTLDWMVIGIK